MVANLRCSRCCGPGWWARGDGGDYVRDGGKAEMENAVKREKRGWTWIAIALVAALGAMVVAVRHEGAQDPPAVRRRDAVLVACALWMQDRASRRAGEAAIERGEAAWSQLGVGLVAILVLGGISLGSMQGSWRRTCSSARTRHHVALPGLPASFRRGEPAPSRRAEDERDRAIRAQGDYCRSDCSNSLAGLAILWVLAPQFFRSPGGPLQVARC